MLCLRFCARAFSSCGKRGPLFIAVRGPLTVVASLVAEHKPQTRRLSSCDPRVQLLRGMWDPPRPGLEPVSPALAGGFLTTAPPGKPRTFLIVAILQYLCSLNVFPLLFLSLHIGCFLSEMLFFCTHSAPALSYLANFYSFFTFPGNSSLTSSV